MTVTKTDLPRVLGEIVAIAQTVESGQGCFYLGMNSGKLLKYNEKTGVITALQQLVGDITSMLYDASTYIYIGTGAGVIYRYTVADGTITTLYAGKDGGIKSLTLYSSILYAGMTGTKFASITVS